MEKQEELALLDAEGIRDRWMSKGARASVKALVPHVTIKVLARSIMTQSGIALHTTKELEPQSVKAADTPSIAPHRRELSSTAMVDDDYECDDEDEVLGEQF